MLLEKHLQLRGVPLETTSACSFPFHLVLPTDRVPVRPTSSIKQSAACSAQPIVNWCRPVHSTSTELAHLGHLTAWRRVFRRSSDEDEDVDSDDESVTSLFVRPSGQTITFDSWSEEKEAALLTAVERAEKEVEAARADGLLGVVYDLHGLA